MLTCVAKNTSVYRKTEGVVAPLADLKECEVSWGSSLGCGKASR